VPKATVESLSRKFHDRLGYWPNLSNPGTIQEKLLWRVFFEDMTEAVRLADKVAVRDYVRERAGEKYLVEALAIVESEDDLDFDLLPDAFALKVNHMSGANMMVKDRSGLDEEAVRRMLRTLLKMRYGSRTGEHWYGPIPPKLLVERLLVDSKSGVPIEYKVHTFHGRVEFIAAYASKSLSEGRNPNVLVEAPGALHVDTSGATISQYDRNWNPTPYRFGHTDAARPPNDPKPSVLGEMIGVAEQLAGDWGYVRVDFNCVDDRELYFAEMTFSPGAGLSKYVPDHYNEYLGSLWDINRRYVRIGDSL